MKSMRVELQKRIDKHLIQFGRVPESIRLSEREMNRLKREWNIVGIPTETTVIVFQGIPITISKEEHPSCSKK